MRDFQEENINTQGKDQARERATLPDTRVHHNPWEELTFDLDDVIVGMVEALDDPNEIHTDPRGVHNVQYHVVRDGRKCCADVKEKNGTSGGQQGDSMGGEIDIQNVSEH